MHDANAIRGLGVTVSLTEYMTMPAMLRDDIAQLAEVGAERDGG